MPNGATGSGEKQQERELRIARAERRKRGRRFLAIGIVLLVVGGAVLWFSGPGRQRVSVDGPGERYPGQGASHVPLGTAFAYNSNPPTSGPHFASPANWGVYDYEVPDQIFLHNLEHGGIWFSYRSGIPAMVIEELKALVDEFGGSKIVMAPRSANDTDIALAAWTRLLKIKLEGNALTEAQNNEIRSFYRAYKNRGPEFVPDTMPGVDPKNIR